MSDSQLVEDLRSRFNAGETPTKHGVTSSCFRDASVYLKLTSNSGIKRRHAFCPNCGSPKQ